jgi:pSer/pThr/pTyr-binding forkhead associated (FHA) protein
MNASDAHIVVHQDPTTQQIFPLTEGTLTMGREAYNDVVLIDPEASRRHAQISFQSGRYVVEDLGSTNGTYVNGRQIASPTVLSRGDVIEVGDMARIVFQGPGAKVAETMMRAPSAGRDETIAMPEDLATFAEKMPPPAPPAGRVAALESTPPPPAPQAPMAMPRTPAAAKEGGSGRRTLAIVAIVLVVLLIVCVGAAFLLDALVDPDVLYCEAGQPLFEFVGKILGFTLACA